jgi:hypothetical protein
MTFRPVLLVLCVFAARAQSPALAPEQRQTAAIIGVASALDRSEALRSAPASTATTLDRLLLREEITEGILAASLDVDAVIASIQREQAQIQAAVDYLSGRRDRQVALATTAATISGGGIGIVGTAMQFNDRTAYAGDGVSIAAGAASTLLSLLSMRLQRGNSTHIDIAPNMLARAFGRPSETISVWPEDVWQYLNSVPAGGIRGQTRLESLIEDWTRQGHISSQAGPETDRKIALLTSPFSGNRKLNLNDLTDRSAMLADLRAQVALLKRDLSGLVDYLRRSGW